MIKPIKRVYVETSVISGMFDKNDHPTKAQPFWDAVERGEIHVVLSDVLEREINDAPQHVRDFYRNIRQSQIEQTVSTEESNKLVAVYIAGGIVSQQHLTDCQHVALAAVAQVDAIVSWNCRHIVHHNRIDRYNAFNVAFGLPKIKILTPDEVIP